MPLWDHNKGSYLFRWLPFLISKMQSLSGLIGQNSRIKISLIVSKWKIAELGSFSEETKHACRNAHWKEDLKKAYDAGRKMAEQ